MSRRFDDDNPPDQTELAKERDDYKAHCLNLMAKLEIRENFIPRVGLDLASTHKLEREATECGSLIRLRPMEFRDPAMGS